jgi:dGTPase
MEKELAGLKGFLFAHMYRHPRVMESMDIAKRIVTELFTALSNDSELLPPDWKAACSKVGEVQTAQVARDYIAGMTDRFAILEHRRVFGSEIDLCSGEP